MTTAKLSCAGSQNGSRIAQATSTPLLTTLSIWRINRSGTEARASIDRDRVSVYGQILAETGYLDPVIVFRDPATEINWLSDGHHRWHAHHQQDVQQILAEVRIGTKRDAVLWGIHANARHGAGRVEADIEANLRTLLGDPEWSRWSDREIARIASVSHQTVARRRKELQKERRPTSGPLDHMRNTVDGNNLGESDGNESRKCRRGDQVYDVRASSANNSSARHAPTGPTAEEIAAADAEVDAEERAAKAEAVQWMRCPTCRGHGKVRRQLLSIGQ